jgi:hypothetical protein
MKRFGFAVLVVVLAGCATTPSEEGAGQPVANPQPKQDGTTRAMRMAKAKPPFSGVWVSPKRYTVNDWQVALLPDGEMAVSGPGVRGHGRYQMKGEKAVGTYEERNGEPPQEPEESKVTFELDPQTKELTFQTGIPGDDVPVRLVPQDEEF